MQERRWSPSASCRFGKGSLVSRGPVDVLASSADAGVVVARGWCLGPARGPARVAALRAVLAGLVAVRVVAVVVVRGVAVAAIELVDDHAEHLRADLAERLRGTVEIIALGLARAHD